MLTAFGLIFQTNFHLPRILGRMPMKQHKANLKPNRKTHLGLIVIFMILPMVSVFSAVHTATTNGNWSNGTTWDSGSTPVCGDTVVIPTGITVAVNIQVTLDGCADPTFILVEGTLDFSSGKKIALSAGSGVTITSSGQIIGSGGGKANLITIGGVDVWSSSGGDITIPTVLGGEFGVEIKSIVSGDFNIASTWDCNCVPDSTNVATIVAGHTVTVSSSATIFDLNINGVLEILNTQELYVRNTWNNNGSFLYNESTVSFGGSGARSLSGITNQSFYNINVKNGCDLSNNAGLLNLIGIMTFRNGTFNTNDSLNLVSSLGETGAIGSLSLGTINGNVFSNRHIMSGATGWRFLTSCIQGATLEDIDDDIITAGLPGSDFPSFSFVSVYDYDETVPGHKDSGYVVPPSMSQGIDAGKGYWIYAGDNLTGTAAFNIDFYGTINQGSTDLPVTYTNSFDAGDGWNLVANPYPCSIDWDDPNWTKTNISDETHIFDPNSGTYAVYAGGVSANGGSKEIASNQAFWIKATAVSPTLTVEEDCKVRNNADPYKSQNQNNTLKVYCKKEASSQFRDEIVLVHNDSYKQDILATKFLSTNDSVLNIMFHSDSIVSSIYNVGSIFDTIPLQLIGDSPNTIISFKNDGFLEQFWSVYLLDRGSNTKYTISNDGTVNLNKSISSIDNDLALIVVPKVMLEAFSPTCELSENGALKSNVKNMDYYMSLTKTSTSEIKSSQDGAWKNLTSGQYTFTVSDPVNQSNSYDTILSLSPIRNTVNLVSSSVVTNDQELVLDAPFTSLIWNINQQVVETESNSIDLNNFSDKMKENDGNIIQCIYSDSIGCKNALQWTVFYNKPPLVYPNPYSSEKSLNVLLQEGDNTIEIFNLTGQLIHTTEVSMGGTTHVKINNLNLKKGQYIILIRSMNTTNYTKLIVNG